MNESGYLLREYPDFSNLEKWDAKKWPMDDPVRLITLDNWNSVKQSIASHVSGYNISTLKADFNYISDVCWLSDNVTAHVNECSYDPLNDGLTKGYWTINVNEIKDRTLDEITSAVVNQTDNKIIDLTDDLAKAIGVSGSVSNS